MEIGSFHGRSAIVLARGSADTASVTAIDPHAGNDRGPQQIEGTADEGEADHGAFQANLRARGRRRRACDTCGCLSAGRARRGRGRDRPAVRGRRPPLRARPATTSRAGASASARRRAADPRRVLVGRRDAGSGAAAPLRRRVRATSAAPARWRDYRRERPRTAAGGCATRRASSASCRGSRATWRSRSRSCCACGRSRGRWAIATAPGRTERQRPRQDQRPASHHRDRDPVRSRSGSGRTPSCSRRVLGGKSR